MKIYEDMQKKTLEIIIEGMRISKDNIGIPAMAKEFGEFCHQYRLGDETKYQDYIDSLQNKYDGCAYEITLAYNYRNEMRKQHGK